MKTLLATFALILSAGGAAHAVNSAATVDQVAHRLNNAQPVGVGEPPDWESGDCDSFKPVLRYFGASDYAVNFFVPRILFRESGCGRDVLNERTGDSGPCQINPIHNRAGYFGGTYFGDGGWLFHLHGLRTRQDLTNPEWLNACLTLMQVCGTGPWAPPYTCANRRLT